MNLLSLHFAQMKELDWWPCLKPLSDQKAFARRLRGVLKFAYFFQNAMRTPRKHDFICKKKKKKKKASHGVLTASSSRPRRSYGVITAFCGVLCGVPWSLHDVFTAFARRSRRSHRASTAF